MAQNGIGTEVHTQVFKDGTSCVVMTHFKGGLLHFAVFRRGEGMLEIPVKISDSGEAYFDFGTKKKVEIPNSLGLIYEISKDDELTRIEVKQITRDQFGKFLDQSRFPLSPKGLQDWYLKEAIPNQ